MPICKNCGHRGEDHNWHLPPPPADKLRKIRYLNSRRVRGQCFCCACRSYVPFTEQPRSVNRLLGRMLRRRR